MKTWRNTGLWAILSLVLLAGLWPVITRNAANRELIFTVLLSLVLASSLNIILGYAC